MQARFISRSALTAAIALGGLTVAMLPGQPSNAQGLPPGYKRPILKDTDLTSKTVSLTINNPSRFKVQIKAGDTWEAAGNAVKIIKSYSLPNSLTARKTVQVRIGEGQNIFHHTPPSSFFGEMYSKATYTVTLGFNGVENRGLSVDCSEVGGRIRNCGQVTQSWELVNPQSVTLTLGHNPLTVDAKLGVGQLSFAPYPVLLQTCSLGSSTYLPWFAGSINGESANGTSNNIELTNFNASSPLTSLTSWCSRNASGNSGFISKALKYSDIAIAAYTPNQILKQATTGKLQGKTIWSPTSTFKVYVKSGNSFQTTATGNGQHNLELLRNLFTSSNKTLFVIKSVTPSGQALSHTVADFSGVINQLNSTTGSVNGCDGAAKPSHWCGTMGRNTTFRIKVAEGELGVPTLPFAPDPDIYSVTLNSPMNISIQNASITMPSQGVMKLRLQVKTSAISGEVWAKGATNDWDPDYSVSAGTFTFEVPFSITKSGNSLVVRQTQNCNSGEYCMTSASGFNLSIDNYPFVGDAEKAVTAKLRNKFKSSVGNQLQAALSGINGKTFNLAPSIPGVNDPMNALLGVSSAITPDLSISDNKLRLSYRPQATFATPALLNTLAPTYTVPNLNL